MGDKNGNKMGNSYNSSSYHEDNIQELNNNNSEEEAIREFDRIIDELYEEIKNKK
jgi:hypothetical protein